jgi:hypothetical protein
MPIEYSVSRDGHFIHAIASDPVTGQEFVEYEVAHAIDERIKPPISELLEIQSGALKQVTKEDISRALERRKELGSKPTPHRCAIVVSYGNTHSWDLGKFYEGLVVLHAPEVVIVFGDYKTARTWLGVEDITPNKGLDRDK